MDHFNRRTVENIFGNSAFKDRNFPDSSFIVDHAQEQGGIIKFFISTDHPIIIVYDWYMEEITIEFYFEKHGAHVENNCVVYKYIV